MMMIRCRQIYATKLLQPVVKRHFFRELGIADCNETDVLVAMKEGIYQRQAFLTSAKMSRPHQKVERVDFAQNGRLIIFDYSNQLPQMQYSYGYFFFVAL
jgi:hypothetical protein